MQLEVDQHVDHEGRSPLMEKPGSRRRMHKRSIFYVFLLGLALLTFLAIVTIRNRWLMFPLRTSTSRRPAYQDCGASPSEARRRCCSFDILSFAWQTPECYDHANTEAFRTHKGNESWAFFTDLNSAAPQRTEVEVLTGEVLAFVTAEYHLTHCTYMWRQLHRAYTLKGYIDEHLDNWKHTLHCQKVLLGATAEEKGMQTVNTVGRIIYPRCRKIW